MWRSQPKSEINIGRGKDINSGRREKESGGGRDRYPVVFSLPSYLSEASTTSVITIVFLI